jgi:fermentation-respiration switch protein FrsA (DUF1100 family)
MERIPMPKISRTGLVSLLVLTAMAASAATAGAVSSTMKLHAPAKIDKDKKFPVVVTGTAKRSTSHNISLYYRNDSAGPCAATIGEEAFATGHYTISYLVKLKVNKHNEYHYTSPKLYGGQKATGKICGYMSDKDGNTEVKKTKSIKFT